MAAPDRGDGFGSAWSFLLACSIQIAPLQMQVAEERLFS